MLNIKHASLTLGALALCACSVSFSSNPDGIKSKLEEAGYSVSLISGSDYENTATASIVDGGLSLENFLSASKASEHNYLMAWFFDDIDSANTWSDLNSAWLSDISFGDDEAKPTSGSSGNAVWYGTKDAAKTAGFLAF